MINQITSRWHAFGVHLSISILILVAMLAVIFFIWFPYELIYAGGIHGLKILIGVDLVLGPLLTLIVFKQGKKSLKFDLTSIALLQIICLAAGLWLIYNERPVLQVLADDGVHLLAASDVKNFELDTGSTAIANTDKILLDFPHDRAALSGIKFTSEFVEQKPFAFRSDLYLPMHSIDADLFRQRIDFILQGIDEQQSVALSKLEPSSARSDGRPQCTWIPIHSKHVGGYACFDFETGITRLSDRQL